MRKATRALREFRIDGVATNIAVPRRRCWRTPISSTNRIATDFIDRNIAELVEAADGAAEPLILPQPSEPVRTPPSAARRADRAGRRGDGRRAPLQGTIVSIEVKEGEVVRPGQQLAVIEVHEDGASGHGRAWRPRR